MPVWTWLVPVISLVSLVAALMAGVGAILLVLCGICLMGTVIAAVHHAEVVAHRVGEPFGTLVLALAVTIIEAALILSMSYEEFPPLQVAASYNLSVILQKVKEMAAQHPSQ